MTCHPRHLCGLPLPRFALLAATSAALLGMSGCATAPGMIAGAIGAVTKPADEPGASPLIPADLRPLFVKGTVNGADLYNGLRQMRTELQAKRSARAWAQTGLLLDSLADRALTGGSGFSGLLDATRKMAMDAAVSELRQRATVVAYQALDEHLSVLLGAQLNAAMAAETITLPSGKTMSANQAKRTVTMATMIVAARLSGRVLEEAEKDFKSLEVDYKSLLERREKAAELLFKVVDSRRAAIRAGNAGNRRAAEADMRRTLSDADLSFIDSALNTMNLTEFSKDMAAQNLALQYLQQQDQKAFAEYSAQSDDVVRRTRAYLRSVAGVAAFGSLLANFVQTVGDIASEQKFDDIWSAMPLAYEFGVAAIPVVQKAGSVAISGVGFPSFLQTRNLFNVTVDGQTKDVRDTKAVFEAIKSNDATTVFSGILFREDATGWLNGVRRCDSAEAGRMLDASVSRTERAQFAERYFGDSSRGIMNEYAFVNAFTVPSLGDRERRLADDLLGRNHRARFSGLGGEHLAEVQNRVSERYSSWSNQQLLRLIFSNREGAARYATMDLGRVSVRPTPSPEAVFVYESYINTCVARHNPTRTTPPAAPPRPVPAAPSRPAAPPSSAPPTR